MLRIRSRSNQTLLPVSSEMCCLQSCPYTIRLKDDARHAIATPRRVPLPYHEKVKKELERMRPLGVIEEATGPTDLGQPHGGGGNTSRQKSDAGHAIYGSAKNARRITTLQRHGCVFGEISARPLASNGTDWIWGPAQQKAFDDLKRMLSQAPVLAFYDPDAVTIVSADASSYGMGAVLLQVQPDGNRAAIAYASRAMTEGEKRYAQIEKEAFAMKWGCEYFGQYLLGRTEPFTVETDHKPLVSIMNLQDLSQCPPRLQRLKLRLAPFSFESNMFQARQFQWLMPCRELPLLEVKMTWWMI